MKIKYENNKIILNFKEADVRNDQEKENLKKLCRCLINNHNDYDFNGIYFNSFLDDLLAIRHYRIVIDQRDKKSIVKCGQYKTVKKEFIEF